LYRRLRYGCAFRRIALTQGKFAIVDPADFERLSKYKWFAQQDQRTFYAVRRIRLKRDGRPKAVWMHREVTRAGDGEFCDHLNHKGLDNRKANLRLATRSQNAWNRRIPNVKSRSKYKGVSWYNREKRRNARILVNGKQKFLGIFADEIVAAKAYDTAARKYHGQFAALNFDKEDNARAGGPGKVGAGNRF